MGWINIDCLEPGMVLGADLVAPDGRFLLPRGTALRDRYITVGKAWGVRRAEIVGLDQDRVDADRAADIGEELLEQSLSRLAPFLRCATDDHPAMREIVRIAVERTALDLAAGKQPECFADEQQPVPELRVARSEDGEQAAGKLVQAHEGLVSLPVVYGKIMEVLESPNSSAFHVAEVVGKDSSLSAKLLKLVNSPLYTFPSRIDSIPRAVALLGTRELSSLALGISVVSAFKGIPPATLNMEQFWKHSVSTAVYASLIAIHVRGVSRERCFTGGLLHDLGWLVMLSKMPDACAQAMFLSRGPGVPLYLVEQELLGFDHAQVGGMLCRQWRLPENLADMIRWHHAPERAPLPVEAGILHLANLLAMAAGVGAAGAGVLPPLHVSVWDLIGMSLSDIGPLVRQADRQIRDILHVFLQSE
ncbi:HDOD domain-containing protein [Desulfonatronum sp. SC1]|uniref:HDOD domain-containing protein n=1 Tax=Desulfonatronum sp. SC1 TaxID=2109626 RepID=UPI000D300D10|nr:HDOD domain-containing protein [Desulfonatronum sp. SC1]PTN37311.1 phosphohydrolase [Desulfonatronum sp. SC1]